MRGHGGAIGGSYENTEKLYRSEATNGLTDLLKVQQR